MKIHVDKKTHFKKYCTNHYEKFLKWETICEFVNCHKASDLGSGDLAVSQLEYQERHC